MFLLNGFFKTVAKVIIIRETAKRASFFFLARTNKIHFVSKNADLVTKCKAKERFK